MDRTPSTRARSLLANGLLALAAGSLCLLGLEIGLRIAASEEPTEAIGPRDNEWLFFQYDELLGWRNRPGAHGWFSIPDSRSWIDINSHGLRDGECEPGAPEGPGRILVLGDSFTWGFGVERGERYTDRLAAMLAGGAEVINAGVSGYGTDQELLYLETEGLAWHSDLVIVQFGLEDVINNNHSIQYSYPKPHFLLSDDRLIRDNVPVPRRRAPWSIRFELPSELQSRPVTPPPMRPAARPEPSSHFRRFKLFLRRHVRSYGFLVDGVRRVWRLSAGHREAPLPQVETVVDRLTAAIFRRIKAVAEANGANLVVVFVPYRHHMEKGVGDSAHDAYLEFFEQAGLHYLDLWEPFRRQTARGAHLYFDVDPHWTPAGHELAAEELARFLRRARMLPAAPPSATAASTLHG